MDGSQPLRAHLKWSSGVVAAMAAFTSYLPSRTSSPLCCKKADTVKGSGEVSFLGIWGLALCALIEGLSSGAMARSEEGFKITALKNKAVDVYKNEVYFCVIRIN